MKAKQPYTGGGPNPLQQPHHRSHEKCETHISLWTGKSAYGNPVELIYCSTDRAVVVCDVKSVFGITLPADQLGEFIKVLQIVEELRK